MSESRNLIILEYSKPLMFYWKQRFYSHSEYLRYQYELLCFINISHLKIFESGYYVWCSSIHSTNQWIKKFNIWVYTIHMFYFLIILQILYYIMSVSGSTKQIWWIFSKKYKCLTIHNLYLGVRHGPLRKK